MFFFRVGLEVWRRLRFGLGWVGLGWGWRGCGEGRFWGDYVIKWALDWVLRTGHGWFFVVSFGFGFLDITYDFHRPGKNRRGQEVFRTLLGLGIAIETCES